MPTQDRTRHLVVMLVEPILGPERVALQAWGVAMVEVEGHDLGRVIAANMPGGLLAQLPVFAEQVLLQDLRLRRMRIEATWIPVGGIVGT